MALSDFPAGKFSGWEVLRAFFIQGEQYYAENKHEQDITAGR